MTLVVARILGERIAIASDTMLTEHGRSLPHQQGVIKSCMLPGDICASFANSPELAARDFRRFIEKYPQGTEFAEAVSFFEKSSDATGNDYIVAFSRTPKLAKIVNGERIKGTAKTQWIGDKSAYERFREYEAKHRKGVESGRAVNGVLFADELPRSPASDLYSTMRNVIADREIKSTGGFVCVVSNRDGGFRHSVYSDMLFNWPEAEAEDFVLQLHHQMDFGASGENAGYAVAQISTGFIGLNVVAFYLLKAKKLFLYHGIERGLANKCLVIRDVEPVDISQKLRASTGIDLRWLLIITSASGNNTNTVYRSPIRTEGTQGRSFRSFATRILFPKQGADSSGMSSRTERYEFPPSWFGLFLRGSTTDGGKRDRF